MPIDLNADVGEGDVAAYSDDEQLLRSVTSVNIACGFHAGSHELMQRTVELARHAGVTVGAHPGFQDRESFGRREWNLAPDSLMRAVSVQVEALAGIAAAHNVQIRHVKPHGALYNMCARRLDMATLVARAVRDVDSHLVLVGLAGSHLVAAGEALGLAVAREGFVDRRYRADGQLVPRTESGAVLGDDAAVVGQAVQLAVHRSVVVAHEHLLPLEVDTLCIHGDTPGAARLASTVRAALTALGVEVRALVAP